MHCPHCKKIIDINIEIKIPDSPDVGLRGRDLLNYFIKKCGKTIKTIGEEMHVIPNKISNMRNGRTAIGHKSAMTLSEYFSHRDWRDFLTDHILEGSAFRKKDGHE